MVMTTKGTYSSAIQGEAMTSRSYADHHRPATLATVAEIMSIETVRMVLNGSTRSRSPSVLRLRTSGGPGARTTPSSLTVVDIVRQSPYAGVKTDRVLELCI